MEPWNGPRWVKRVHKVFPYPRPDTEATKPEDLEVCAVVSVGILAMIKVNILPEGNITCCVTPERGTCQDLCTTPGREPPSPPLMTKIVAQIDGELK